MVIMQFSLRLQLFLTVNTRHRARPLWEEREKRITGPGATPGEKLVQGNQEQTTEVRAVAHRRAHADCAQNAA